MVLFTITTVSVSATAATSLVLRYIQAAKAPSNAQGRRKTKPEEKEFTLDTALCEYQECNSRRHCVNLIVEVDDH